MVAIGVFNGALRLTDTTQTANSLRLCYCRCFAYPEHIIELLQDVLAPGEVWVTGIGYIPDRWENPRKALWHGYRMLSSTWETWCSLRLATLMSYTLSYTHQ